jgi:hypothetical protein
VSRQKLSAAGYVGGWRQFVGITRSATGSRMSSHSPLQQSRSTSSAAWYAASGWHCWKAPISTIETAASSTPTCPITSCPSTPTFAALDATFLPAEDTIADPLGVKGLAEVVIVGVPAAIANAVFNATGKRVTDLPITLDKLL